MPSARVAKLLADRLLLLVSHRLFIPIQHVSPAMYTSTSRGIRANCDDTPVSPYSAANGGSLVSNGRTKTNQTDIDFSTFPSPAFCLYNSHRRGFIRCIIYCTSSFMRNGDCRLMRKNVPTGGLYLPRLKRNEEKYK